MLQIFYFRVTLTIFVLFTSMFFRINPVLAQNVSEYEVKAAFLFNFINFVEWPEEVINGEYCIGVLGESPITPHLKQIGGKEIKGRKVVVKIFEHYEEVDFCHVLFISRDYVNNPKKATGKLYDSPTLTVSESKGFIQMGGIINLVLIGKKVRFSIDNAHAMESGIKISSKLLRLSLQEQN